MMRSPPLAPDQWSAAQRRVAEAIAAGPRGGLRGPFIPLLHSPELAQGVQALGEYLRFRSALPQALVELAVLVTARRWTAQYEWHAHARLAREAGLDGALIDAIAAGKRPPSLSAEEAVIHDFAVELHHRHQVSDQTFAAARSRFGERAVIDLVGILGYYAMIAMVLNVAEVPLPEGVPAPLAAAEIKPA